MLPPRAEACQIGGSLPPEEPKSFSSKYIQYIYILLYIEK